MLDNTGQPADEGMMTRVQRVLVTGAGGFIGSHVCESVLASGAAVRALVRYSSHDQLGALAHLPDEVRDELEIVPGDLRDADAVSNAVQGCDVVLHLGALISIPYSYLRPGEVVETNVLGSLNIFEAA